MKLTNCALLVPLFVFLASCNTTDSARAHDLSSVTRTESSAYLITAPDGRVLKISPYGDAMVRLQTIRPGESFLPDNHYEMVVTHDWPGGLELEAGETDLIFATERLEVHIDRYTLGATFFVHGIDTAVLKEAPGVTWNGTKIAVKFTADDKEHFSGLGHGYFARENSVDLKGQVVQRNYGRRQIEQAPLIVPFFMSSKGYGLFLNSMYPNTFKFAVDGEYEVSIDDHGFDGRMDYFFIAGPKLTSVLNRYVELTGRPRLPMKSMFGLQLSDKGHDHNSESPSDEDWWKTKIGEHRAKGFPIDHIVNDNRWRAAGGKRCESRIEWDSKRYPDPASYNQWLDQNGLVMTVDFNRCIARFSDGWKPDFNLPRTGDIEFADSAPDLTNRAFREWFWQVFFEKTLDPTLNYPGDALWIDEFDEQGAAPMKMILANGGSSAEMRNYWFFLIAKALVEEGWDQAQIENRPFVWVRGMTAGAQRFATLWSGDIHPSYSDMRAQIRSMQLAGLSGFPFWGHDAGGFYDWDKEIGPDDNMYMQWAMAFGSFAPIWKPHGMGRSRWPTDRSEDVQAVADRFARLRYELMPYTYTSAHRAAETGLPIARPMLLAHQDNPLAWKHDLQYLWGSDVLVAPNTADLGNVDVWLPDGVWYEYDGDQAIAGGKVISVHAMTGDLPMYARAGAIIPKREFALSTAFIDKTSLLLDIYTGANGSYQLIEDDDKTEAYRTKNERMLTDITFDDEQGRLVIHGASGSYNGAPARRSYEVRILGLQAVESVLVNGEKATYRQIGRRVYVVVPHVPIRSAVVIDIVPQS